MKILPGNAQHIGRRAQQQDAFGFSDPGNSQFVAHGGVFAVLADGMGGHQLGDLASQTAVRVMREAYESKTPDESIPEALKRSLLEANRAVFRMAEENDVTGDAGTTLVAVVIFEQSLYWISVGDSHLYLLRKGNLSQLNTDHIYARELAEKVLQGEISQDEADTHPDRHALTSSLGGSHIHYIDESSSPCPLEPNDRILLCSDGLYNTLSDTEIVHALSGSAQEAAETLVEQVCAKDKANQDNVTVLLFDIHSESKPEKSITGRKFWPHSGLLVLILVSLLALLFYSLPSGKLDITQLFSSKNQNSAPPQTPLPPEADAQQQAVNTPPPTIEQNKEGKPHEN